MRDSIEKGKIIDIMNNNSHIHINANIMDKNALNRKIEGMKGISVLEWIRNYIEHDKINSQNILTNI